MESQRKSTVGQQAIQQSELSQTRKTINAIASNRRLVMDEVREQFHAKTREHVDVMKTLCQWSHEIAPTSAADWDGFQYMLEGVVQEYEAEIKLFDVCHEESPHVDR